MPASSHSVLSHLGQLSSASACFLPNGPLQPLGLWDLCSHFLGPQGVTDLEPAFSACQGDLTLLTVQGAEGGEGSTGDMLRGWSWRPREGKDLAEGHTMSW